MVKRKLVLVNVIDENYRLASVFVITPYVNGEAVLDKEAVQQVRRFVDRIRQEIRGK